jgi:hypothetical protein
MKFTPKTDQQIAEENLIPTGTVCDFEVLNAEEKLSKAGNEMVALELKVWRPNGSTTIMRDWLLTDMMWKLKAFADAVGMTAEYDRGELPPDIMIGKAGKLKVGIRPANGDFPPSNSVTGYVRPEGAAAPARPAPVAAKLDDEIPF